jgi:phenylalanine-4-hydroxylase
MHFNEVRYPLVVSPRGEAFHVLRVEETVSAQSAQQISLTTGKAPFIEEARADGRLYIEQPYEMYTEDNHEAWRVLYDRMYERWDRYANSSFLGGLERLRIDATAIPKLEDVNRFLAPLTGFKAKPVSGYVPAFVFFDCLGRREFPTTITIRDAARLDYLPEPDIFHDVAGHVPMHTDPEFANVLARFGACASTAADMIRSDRGSSEERIRRMTGILKAMARFFWFTIEFGLVKERDGLKALGSGLLSSYGELEHSVRSDSVQRYPVQFEWIINQSFEVFHYQPLLFWVDSFEHLFDLVIQLEQWMVQGKLDNAAPGEPALEDRDVASFIEYEASTAA